MTISVIVPAYNEINVIDHTLKPYASLTTEVQVIVVCNGCTDGTEDHVRSNYPWVELIVLDEGSKVKAINAGNKVAKYFPRVYQDADVILSINSILNIEKEFDCKQYLFASPSVSLKGDKVDRIVKQYYEFIYETPAYKAGMVNSGVYILSKEALEKIGEFPNIIADDGFVKGCLGVENLQRLYNSTSIVGMPTKTISLVKVKTRSQLGNFQLKKLLGFSPSNGSNNFKSLLSIVYKSKKWIPFFCYVSIMLMCKLRASAQLRFNVGLQWERDECTRLQG